MRSEISRHDLSEQVLGSHLCGLYETEEERRFMLANFVRQGLERGEKVLFIKDRLEDEDILVALTSDKLPVEDYLRKGQLRLLSAEDTYLADGLFGGRYRFDCYTQLTGAADYRRCFFRIDPGFNCFGL